MDLNPNKTLLSIELDKARELLRQLHVISIFLKATREVNRMMVRRRNQQEDNQRRERKGEKVIVHMHFVLCMGSEYCSEVANNQYLCLLSDHPTELNLTPNSCINPHIPMEFSSILLELSLNYMFLGVSFASAFFFVPTMDNLTPWLYKFFSLYTYFI